MPSYLKLGSIPRKRHIAHKQAPGFLGEGIAYEEVITSGGFGRAYSIVYHLRPPTRVRSVEPAGTSPLEFATEPVLRHHHLKTGAIPRAGDPVTGRVPLLANDDVVMSRCRPAGPQAELFRNATADEVVFVHRGTGMLFTMFGPLQFRPYDYVVIPRTTTYRLEFDGGEEPDLLVFESAGDLTVPPRYLNPDGQLRLGAPYGERDLHGPREVAPIDQDRETSVLIKDGPRLSRSPLPHPPSDVIGWEGMVSPSPSTPDDFEPIPGNVHHPPPVQQTFE